MGQVIHGERTTIRPITDDDLDLLVGWFAEPEVYRWWDGTPKPREEVAAEYLGRRPPPPVVHCFIIEAAGEPIGYIQHWQDDPGSGGIDMFLIPSWREQDLGTDAARAMVRHLLLDLRWRRVTVDLSIDNPRAIRAWEKAGFKTERELPDHPDGPALLMAMETEVSPDIP